MPKKRPAQPAPAEVAHITADLRPLAVALDTLEPDPANARTHDEANVASIAASLRQFGQVKPIVANRRNGQVVAGNGTLAAAKSLSWKYIAVAWGDWDESNQRALAIADNRTAELADWDLEILAAQIDAVTDDLPDLAAAMLLADLIEEEGQDEEDEQDQDGPPPKTFSIIVDCPNAKDQKQLFEQLQDQGRICRLLTS
ncbi:MAG TPA: ParB N-terminal domain-containing protein [Phycisphaerae bacterium]|nr:ParB N-terminal domain-containing protein [Thermoguttaceae bacterium]HUU91533.1 ParB N-terminal domain-containing protein [Phycisphaerae bacterium]HUX00381.1 ParB N-terminal domain-containing protein [Phycisphaerae bacterium]